MNQNVNIFALLFSLTLILTLITCTWRIAKHTYRQEKMQEKMPKRVYIRGASDRTGSQLHNEMSAMAVCFLKGYTYAGSIGGAHMKERTETCHLLGLPLPQERVPPGAEKLERTEWEELHYDSAFPDAFLTNLQARVHATVSRPVLGRFAAIHIRRGDVSKATALTHRGFARYVDISYFKQMYTYVRDRGISDVHVFSEESARTELTREFPDCVMHLGDRSGEAEAWTYMIHADILVLSPSSFSFVPALLNRSTVIYKPFWHRKLPHWLVGNDLL